MPSGVHLWDDSAAFAANWRTILVIDIGMALIVFAGGLVLAGTGSGWGWVLAAAGSVYVFFACGRAAKWRRLRRQAGLSTPRET
jgi:hypothetical protein